MQTAVSSVLESSTDVTLKQFETHVDDIEAEYVPHLAAFEALKPGTCRDQAEMILNSTTTFTGFSAANCATTYDQRVSAEIEAANRAKTRFDDLFNQVQSVVVKSFSGLNNFLSPEAIEDRITEMYDFINKQWTESKPDLDAIRRNLEAAIKDRNTELGNCHNVILTQASTMFGMFRSNVQTCADFDNTAPAAMSFRAGATNEPFRYILEDFEAEMAKATPYEWKA